MALRLWPGILAVALQWLLRFGLPEIVPDAYIIGVLAGLVGFIAVVVWWAFFSRATGPQRWGGVLLLILALVVTPFFSHPSIASGMMGFLIPIYATPLLSLFFVLWATTVGPKNGPRWASMVAAIVLACVGWTLVRTDGLTGTGGSEFSWRWSPTAEEQLLAQDFEVPPAATQSSETGAAGDALKEAAPAEWPGFRGPRRDGVVRGTRLSADWSAAPPTELWRRPVGPGWSSFAVDGDRIYTQEQRGEEEVVACYSLASGEPLWMHTDPVRFWESNGGAGPRATPTLADGRVYALGATGVLNALSPLDGALLWSRDATQDGAASVPGWGISGSPLVVGDSVLVAVNGTLVAYEAASGEPRWVGPSDRGSYSSPHLAQIDGVEQVLLMSDIGVTSFALADGAALWEYEWPGTSIVQPVLLGGGDLLISTGESSGTRRLRVAHDTGAWSVEPLWTSTRLKPYFNDFVVLGTHAYGLDRGILASIELEGGKRAWKGGRYGCGQVVLLEDSELLLVLSEEGELALVSATPEAFEELGTFPALEGKTWNHPVVVGDVLLVRNDREMAAFRLATLDG